MRQPNPFLKLAMVVLFAGIVTPSCKSTGNSDNSNTNDPAFEVSTSNTAPTAPLEISQSKADLTLCEEINQIIDSRQEDYERWGLIVLSLKDGRVPCARNPRQLFIPASIQKLVTSAVALEKLGIDYRFKTSLYAGGKPKDSVIDGDLILYGRGAPDFDTVAANKLVTNLKALGVRRITGNVIGDESYFRADGLGDGWTWNSAQWYYGAAASALSFERNLVTIRVENGKPKADSDFVELTGEIQPIESVEAIGVKRRLGTNEIHVWGNGSSLNARIAIANPPLFASRVFKEILEKNGIVVEGKSSYAGWTRPSLGESSVELAFVESAALSELIKTMNKDSVNLFAELMIRTLGRSYGKDAPDTDPKMNLLRGDDNAGAAVIQQWLADNNISSNGTAIHDGSGLSRLDRITPELIVRVVALASQSRYSKAFTESLPVAGRNGTLSGRLKSVTGKIAAKTGSVQYANSLAGYANRGTETFAFAIICNDETIRKDSSATIDRIVSRIVTGTP